MVAAAWRYLRTLQCRMGNAGQDRERLAQRIKSR
jgi:hypothetical protein